MFETKVILPFCLSYDATPTETH